MGCRARRRSSPSSQIALTKCHPVARDALEYGTRYTAVEAFEGLNRRSEIGGKLSPCGARSISFPFPRQAPHIRLSACWPNPFNETPTSGYYTNFANLLDLSIVAALAGFDSRGIAVRRYDDGSRGSTMEFSSDSPAACIRAGCAHARTPPE